VEAGRESRVACELEEVGRMTDGKRLKESQGTQKKEKENKN
jgi:hypothetical protein